MTDQQTYTREALDADVARYLELADLIEQLASQQNEIKARFRRLDAGRHESLNGVAVVVTPPPRTFNQTRAWAMLTPEQQQVCVSPDPKKVKGQLAPALLEACMDPGTGEPRVSVK